MQPVDALAVLVRKYRKKNEDYRRIIDKTDHIKLYVRLPEGLNTLEERK
ncbi:MAG: hypothetical protein WAM14_12740 [Candidatus Nitrosopolaris sp.]|jgi:hypothetical protein